jgi:cytochrome c
METRKWKAFLRMNGETTIDTEQDILTEFKAMVEYMKWIGVNYSMVVQVEAGGSEDSQNAGLEQASNRQGSGQMGD